MFASSLMATDREIKINMQTEARMKVLVRRDTRTGMRDRATTLPNDSAKADKANPSSESEEVKLRDASKSVAEANGRCGDSCL